MSQHPLVELASERDVRRGTGFRKVAERLSGDTLKRDFEAERSAAPRRAAAGKRFLRRSPGKAPEGQKAGKDPEHLGRALTAFANVESEGLTLPDEGSVRWIDWQITLREPPTAGAGSDDQKKIPKVDLLGLGPDDRLVVAALKVLVPDAPRAATGDTPLRALIEALAAAAIVAANHDAIAAEILEATGAAASSEPPVVILLGTRRYWELCRKREAQKGAAWISQLERLSREIREAFGVEVLYLTIELEGNPGWDYTPEGPRLSGTPSIEPAWEAGAGKVRPKPRPKPKPESEEPQIVEADLSVPVETYVMTGSFKPGQRIQHPTLGLGVVQGAAGEGKIEVLFDDKRSLLVHERAPRGGASAAAPRPPSQ